MSAAVSPSEQLISALVAIAAPAIATALVLLGTKLILSISLVRRERVLFILVSTLMSLAVSAHLYGAILLPLLLSISGGMFALAVSEGRTFISRLEENGRVLVRMSEEEGVMSRSIATRLVAIFLTYIVLMCIESVVFLSVPRSTTGAVTLTLVITTLIYWSTIGFLTAWIFRKRR